MTSNFDLLQCIQIIVVYPGLIQNLLDLLSLKKDCVSKCEFKEANEQLKQVYPGKLKTFVKESDEMINRIESTKCF